MKKYNYHLNNKCEDCGSKISDDAIYCKPCGYKHRIRPKGLKYKIVKVNRTSFKKGNIPWSSLHPDLMPVVWNKKFENGYDAVHDWVEKIFGKAKEGNCEMCGSNKNMQWSNKSGKYLREKSDWQRLCTKCHHFYDFKMFGARKNFYRGGKYIYG